MIMSYAVPVSNHIMAHHCAARSTDQRGQWRDDTILGSRHLGTLAYFQQRGFVEMLNTTAHWTLTYNMFDE